MNNQKQEKSDAEMQKLLTMIGREVIVNGIVHEMPREERGILIEVYPYATIQLTGCAWPFIGETDGITKITEKATGDVLYENSAFTVSTNKKERVAHMKKMQAEKFGTNQHKEPRSKYSKLT